MLGNLKIIKLIFDRSAFSARELGGKYGNSCYQIAHNPIQAHCHAYKFVCCIKLNHRFLHEKYALMRVLLLFYCQCVPTWDAFCHLCPLEVHKRNLSQVGTHSICPIPKDYEVV